MAGYGQFCPVAKAMEILDERWTLLVVRELLSGSTHFNELRRGVPRMSPALLSKRLRSLERHGLIIRSGSGRATTYAPTDCGRELFDVVQGLGVWGLRWFHELGEQDLDPHLLMWDLRRTLPTERWPSGRTTVALRFDDVEPRAASWWVVVTDGDVDICDYDPGFETSAVLRTSLIALTRIWRGELAWAQAARAGLVRIEAPAVVRRALPEWFGQSRLAQVAAAG